MEEINYVTRIHLKTACNNRKKLIDFCLNGEEKYVAIGWSYVYKNNDKIENYEKYYKVVKNKSKKINHALNVFKETEKNDLFWTRDLEGNYWICRAEGKAISKNREDIDVGAVVPVEAYKVGLEVPGQIKASFTRPNGGICERIKSDNDIIKEYSKYIFNELSGKELYKYKKENGEFIDNLPDFDLEELVISYIQLEKNYYLLSNSIAKHSTTIKIECEFISRDLNNIRKSVVQVKGGKRTSLDAKEYEQYINEGYIVYLYAPEVKDIDKVKNCEEITRNELLLFYEKYKKILPESITKWENMFSITK
jgi:hypothetical protein